MGLLACILMFLPVQQDYVGTSDTLAVQQVITTFFRDFHARDTEGIKAALSKEVALRSIYADKEGKAGLHTETLEDFLNGLAKIPKEWVFEERIGSCSIQVDGDMAHAWVPYTFWLNGKFHHCGVNSFRLFLEDGVWKVISILDTRRTEGCI